MIALSRLIASLHDDRGNVAIEGLQSGPPHDIEVPHLIDASGGAFEAFRAACAHTWGCRPVEAGSGGSLPLVAALADTFPHAELLLTGVSDPESRAHSENESAHLGELRNCCVNEAIPLGQLAEVARA